MRTFECPACDHSESAVVHFGGVSMLISLWLCIITSAPILQLCASNNSDEEMCQQVPSASVAMPPLFIALRVVFFDAMFAFLNCSRALSRPLLSS
jgi:hypothetical protein